MFAHDGGITEGLLSKSSREILQKLQSLEREFQLIVYLDSVGEPDFALWSAGARIVRELTSPTYTLDVPLWARLWSTPAMPRPPELALTPGLQAGCCWPMKGQRGSLGVKLAQEIVPRAVTIDHVPGQLAYRNDTAPRLIDVWGILPRSRRQSTGGLQVLKGLKLTYEHGLPDLHPDFYFNNFVLLGHMTYNIHGKIPMQTFNLFSDADALKLFVDTLLFVFKENWGNEAYTCIYRVRVHGDSRQRLEQVDAW
ncbi:hypothetical protein C8T65DRAFT_578748 [Cerioporus squamosus]|nr:hypothetical protein C8T65DRAFT_578748 [Cerioporus squamosus]